MKRIYFPVAVVAALGACLSVFSSGHAKDSEAVTKTAAMLGEPAAAEEKAPRNAASIKGIAVKQLNPGQPQQGVMVRQIPQRELEPASATR